MTKSSVSLTWESTHCRLLASSPFGEVVKSGRARDTLEDSLLARAFSRGLLAINGEEGGYTNG